MLAVETSHSHARGTWLAAAAIVLALLGAACNNNDSTAAAPTPSAPPSPATETLTGSMAPKGTAIRTFTASKAGTVFVTLASAGPPSTIVLGLGVGIPSVTGIECNFSQTVNTPAGSAPQITLPVDTGLYCAGVYDIGNIVAPNGITVSVTVTHP